MASRKLNALLQDFLPTVSRDSEYLPVQPAKAILEKNGKAVSSIRKSAGLSDELFDRFYGWSLIRVAELGQSCPYSENRHHAWPGGLVMHILETAANAMRLRKGRILPTGASPEEEAKKADLYTYAVFAAAVLSDIGFSLSSQRITLHDRKRKFVCEWLPLMDDMPPKVKYMKVEFRKELHRGRHLVSLMYLPRILSSEGVAWMKNDPAVFGEFLNGFTDSGGGPINQLIMKGRKASIDSTTGIATSMRAGAEIKHVGKNKNRENAACESAAERNRAVVEGNPITEKGSDNSEGMSQAVKVKIPDSTGPGEKFQRWLETGLNESRLEVNMDRAPVHVTEKAYFLVVPRIFELFAAEHSMEWEDVQRHVEAMKIHKKNPEDGDGDGNRWQARIQRSGKFSMVKGWLVPKEKLEVSTEMEVNGQLSIRKIKNL